MTVGGFVLELKTSIIFLFLVVGCSDDITIINPGPATVTFEGDIPCLNLPGSEAIPPDDCWRFITIDLLFQDVPEMDIMVQAGPDSIWVDAGTVTNFGCEPLGNCAWSAFSVGSNPYCRGCEDNELSIWGENIWRYRIVVTL